MSKMKQFAVIQFVKGNAVDFVPSSWINEDQLKCRYPKTTYPGFEELRRSSGSTPPKSWSKYSVTIVKTYGNFDKVIVKTSLLFRDGGKLVL